MKTHNMKLFPEPFSLIDHETKVYELRLYDEKRKEVEVGDYIVFTNTKNEMTLKVLVKSINKYNNSIEMLENHDLKELGLKDCDKFFMEDFYGYDKVSKYGIVAIGIKVLEKHKYKPCLEFDECEKLTNLYYGKDNRKWFEGHLKIAQKGYHLAECQIGFAYMNGIGVDVDLEKAKEWTMKAIEHGDSDAIYNLEYLNNIVK